MEIMPLLMVRAQAQVDLVLRAELLAGDISMIRAVIVTDRVHELSIHGFRHDIQVIGTTEYKTDVGSPALPQTVYFIGVVRIDKQAGVWICLYVMIIEGHQRVDQHPGRI